MSRFFPKLFVLFSLVLTAGLAPTAAAAPIPACTATDIINGDSGCPASGLCTITKIFEIGNGCDLDFGTRSVTIASSGELRIDAASVTLRAGTFTVSPGGLVDGRTAAIGGFFRVLTTGNIQVQKASAVGKILTNGSTRGGNIVLDAGGDITIAGQVISNNAGAGSGSGGSITLSAGGNIFTASTSDVDVHGGNLGCGGSIDMIAGGSIDIGKLIDVNGGDGGSINIDADGPVIVRDNLQTTGQGDAGSGGCIDIVGSSVEINGPVQSKGTGSAIDSGGGCGGAVFIQSSFGDTVVRDTVDVTSGGPDGGGGCIEFFSTGAIDIEPSASIVAEGTGGQSCGGETVLDAQGDVSIDGPFQVTGGDSGGCVEVDSRGSIVVNAGVDVNGRSAGSFGGAVSMEAGIGATGSLVVNDGLDASGASCDTFGFCSLGGDIDLGGCDVTVSALGNLDVKAPGSGGSGGSVFLTARDQLTVGGTIDATGGSTTLNGTITFVHPTTPAPIVTAPVTPAAITVSRALCSGQPGDPPFCLLPCPLCGNGTTEYPETCDDTTGTPVSCDGCSAICQLENCNDGNLCTSDLCDATLGCGHIEVLDGTGCDDATVCNGTESCLGGLCVSGPPPDCNDGKPCTMDSCNPATGCQHPNMGAGASCSDGNACTDGDSCDGAGNCTPGGALDCDDNEECTLDTCNTATGCQHDGNPLFLQPCTGDTDPCTVDVCAFGDCVHGDFPPNLTNDGDACDNGDPCTTADTCAGGMCQPGTPVTCTALDQCHDAGVCTPGFGCSNPPKADNSPCDDGNPCTQTDRCQGGTCVGTNPVVCTAAGQCRGVGTCNPATGLCSDPPAPNGMSCDDMNECTQTDTCQNGACSGGNLVVCTPAGTCRGVGVCNPATGVCSDPPAPDGAPCSDGQYCTTDSCQGGACTGTPLSCDDGNVCTSDSCNETLDTCVNDPILLCCGNGIPEPGEECDEGSGNSDAPDSTCLTNCTIPQCGNGVVNAGLGEECDEGANNSDAPNALCRLDCTRPRCGDGIEDDQSGEQCDDGNTSSGDGCSAGCFAEPPATAVRIPGPGNKRTNCMSEWRMENPDRDRKGRPSVRQSCTDGDPSCDRDGVANGECLFEVWMCSNNNDPAVELCTPGNGPNGTGFVAVAEARTPTPRQAANSPVDAQNLGQLLAATGAAEVGESFDVCGPRMRVRVPLKSLFKKGRKKLKVKATSTRGSRDVDSLPLICVPPG